jgi:hypothetical protein
VIVVGKSNHIKLKECVSQFNIHKIYIFKPRICYMRNKLKLDKINKSKYKCQCCNRETLNGGREMCGYMI